MDIGVSFGGNNVDELVILSFCTSKYNVEDIEFCSIVVMNGWSIKICFDLYEISRKWYWISGGISSFQKRKFFRISIYILLKWIG